MPVLDEKPDDLVVFCRIWNKHSGDKFINASRNGKNLAERIAKLAPYASSIRRRNPRPFSLAINQPLRTFNVVNSRQ
ncbi:hypothetical protein PPTG_24167 [Phytophthora nicotianae INRA-310]|uniref:Uncharacterized protein n=1 Tax=Phytophthora nicotianae (strain INRA-310) TaxID=761204 RepID=W2PJV8_PHYN3|nr:hypothetical protein PPTG_24167 [Phytophthora nicotianae INRA-310]ETN00906.1 hypothetical protein PPTG_24167 [Phytophthora nicotianae INRA-310]